MLASCKELFVLLTQKSHDVQEVSLPSTPPGQISSAATVEGHLKAGLAFHSSLQAEDGHFPGDYGGPMFLMPGLVIACYVTGVLDIVLSPEHKQEMTRYLRNHQNEDGGYGLHIEGHSTMFGTGLRCPLLLWIEHGLYTNFALPCTASLGLIMKILMKIKSSFEQTSQTWEDNTLHKPGLCCPPKIMQAAQHA
jgi:hypothetical protein